MSEKHSVRLSLILREAKNLALLYNNPEITDLHVHLAMLRQRGGLIHELLEEFAVDEETYENLLQNAVEKLPHKPGSTNLFYSRDYQRLELIAKQIAKKEYSPVIDSTHTYLGLFELEKSTSLYILGKMGLEKEKCEEFFQENKENMQVTEKYSQGISEVLSQYGEDLTKKARNGELDPVIGMDDEINRVVQILSRRIKNNPIIIGEPGVGKTAVVEGLAQRIVNLDVPEALKNKIIFSLETGNLIAGAKLRGELEERVQEVMDIIKSSNRRIILFIDEIHTIVGTGGGSGGIDISNIIKPMLSRGEIVTIGATTITEYTASIEKDGALERRFQKIYVTEPNIEQSLSILRGIKDKYEAYHSLRIKDSALVQAVKLSERYITDRNLPDKAIDVMDEACSMLRTEIDQMPLELDEMRRKILQLEKEKVSIKSENDSEKVEKLDGEIKNLKEKFDDGKKIWKDEKSSIKQLKKISSKIYDIERKIEEKKREDDFEEAIKYSEIELPRLKQEQEKLLKYKYRYNMIEEVTENHIAKIVSNLTGIPLTVLNEDEKERLLNLEKTINGRVIGQEEAVRKVSNAVLRSKAGLKKRNKPIGTFLFLGPTGVGKTYLAKILASEIYSDPKSLIRLDMSEYMEKHSVSKLIGAPPGYVGYEEGGQLTEKVRQNPYTIVLLDEIEKASTQVFNILLQLLDEGRLTDSQGRLIDFTNSIIIMTSNIGSENLNSEENESKEEILQKYFKPEFINRLDSIIRFNRLTREDIQKIAILDIREMQNYLQELKTEVNVSDEVLSHIIEISNYEFFGAREVERLIKDDVYTLLAEEIIKGNVKENSKINLVMEDGSIKANIK